MIRKRYLILLILVAIFFVGCQRDEVLSYGKKAPDISLLDASGKVTKLDDYRGKLVILRFWQKGCGICLVAMPILDKFYKTHKKDIVIIGINMGNKSEYVKDFIKKNSISFPMFTDELKIATKKYGVIVSPTSFVIDKKGILVKKIIGQYDTDKFTKQMLGYL